MRKKLISLFLALILVSTFFCKATYVVNFNDVTSSNRNYSAIQMLAEEGIINGYSDGSYRPDRSVSRAELAKILYYVVGINSLYDSTRYSPFSDVDSSSWAAPYISWAYSEGIINGMGDGTFRPDADVKYEQVVKMVVAALGYTQAEVNSRGGYPDGYLSIGRELGLDYNTDGVVGAPATRGTVAQIIVNADLFPIPESPYTSYSSGDYDKQFSVSFRDLGDNVSIYYTTDGSIPTSDSEEYVSAIPIERSTTLKAIAISNRGKESDVVEYEYTLRKWDAVYDKCEEIISEVISRGMSDLEKEQAIHDYLVINCEYDYDSFMRDTIPDDSYTPYGLLIKGTGVCQAYALTTKLLLEMVGIECIIVSGDADGIGGWGGHAWNIVNIDGAYYHLDVTWDDPVEEDEGYVCYKYFNISDKSMKLNHQWDSDSSLPTCKKDMDIESELGLDRAWDYYYKPNGSLDYIIKWEYDAANGRYHYYDGDTEYYYYE